MGKYARMPTHPGISDPERLADMVVDAWVSAVNRAADEMGNNYINGCKTANKALMIERLAYWYRNVPEISSKYSQIFKEVRIAYRKAIGKA